MSFNKPLVLTTPGPQWARELSSILTDVDRHDHQRSKVTPDGLNIEKNFPFNKRLPTRTRGVKLGSSGEAATGIFSDNGDLYYVNAGGGVVQITNDTAVTAATDGKSRSYPMIEVSGDHTITGDHVLILVDTQVLHGPSTITLPEISSVTPGTFFLVCNKSGNEAITLEAHPGEQIDGEASITTSVTNATIKVVSDGTSWSLLGRQLGSPSFKRNQIETSMIPDGSVSNDKFYGHISHNKFATPINDITALTTTTQNNIANITEYMISGADVTIPKSTRGVILSFSGGRFAGLPVASRLRAVFTGPFNPVTVMLKVRIKDLNRPGTEWYQEVYQVAQHGGTELIWSLNQFKFFIPPSEPGDPDFMNLQLYVSTYFDDNINMGKFLTYTGVMYAYEV